jgi:CRISPR-associated protein Cmr6
MPIAAVPGYLGDNFDQASPGMRFGMYLKILTVPPRSRFVFHVGCDPARLAVVLALRDGRWRERLAEAFEHAFTWLGFGAKAAVGVRGVPHVETALPERDSRPDAEREHD